jgi:hypothetical protein
MNKYFKLQMTEKILDKKYRLIKTLDSGASGSVKLATLISDNSNKPYAIKIYNDL